MVSDTATRHANDGVRLLLQQKTTASRRVAATGRIAPAAAARISSTSSTSRTTVCPRPLASTIASCVTPSWSSAATVQVTPTSTQASSSSSSATVTSTTVTSTQRTTRTVRRKCSTGRSTSITFAILIVPLRLRARCIRLIPRGMRPRSASKPPSNFPRSRKRRRRIRERGLGTSAASRADFCEPIRWCQSGTCKCRRRKRRRKLHLGSRARNRSQARQTRCRPRSASYRAVRVITRPRTLRRSCTEEIFVGKF